eukprot:TRINITY_DN13773_c0_g1_i1.p1 TRINITY_DN13773_c0_g1~~TRINITY_DN13773_c0_g1_i1.p1  ORF type:complete len:926 (+),score=159.52 TRINITY_DN13773_c0_g1_i1:86-2863(+)
MVQSRIEAAAQAAVEGEERLRHYRNARDAARGVGGGRTDSRARSSSVGPAAASSPPPRERKRDRSGHRERQQKSGRGSAASRDGAGSRCRSRGVGKSGAAAAGAGSTGGGLNSAAATRELHGALGQDQGDLDARWHAYLQGEEFLTFHAVVDCLLTLPPSSQLAERRADFELLLHLLHRLGQALEVEHVSKQYRAHYSPDVQLSGYLYSTLLTAFTLLPSYVLNGQEFYVSDTVLDQCQSLQYVFQETCKELNRQFENLQPYSLEYIRNDIRRSLVYFDRSWCRFEMPALEEIEAIHRQACRPLIEAIEVEKALAEWERRDSQAARSCPPGAHRVHAEVHRTRLMEKICELNRLANIDGKGRSDMDLACVLEAERIATKVICPHLRQDGGATRPPPSQPHKCNGCASPVLIRISRSLLRSLERLRRILQRYGRYLYQLNSHLANNPDLVRGLERFEAEWETASRYLVQPGPRRLALLAYDVVTSIKDPGFEEALTNLDPGFLISSLPRAFLLHEMERFTAARKLEASSAAVVDVGKHSLKTGEVKAALGHLVGGRLRNGGRQSPHVKERPGSIGATQGKAATMLPRPLEAARPLPTASAFQFSAMSRAFLPTEMAADYDAAASALGRLSEARLKRVRAMLITTTSALTSPVGSSISTPLIRAGQLPPAPATAERPPRTPCPPRMAVPNSSCGRLASGGTARPISDSKVSVLVIGANATTTAGAPGVAAESTAEEAEESDDDEEVKCTVDLSGLKGAEVAVAAEAVAAAAAAAAKDVLACHPAELSAAELDGVSTATRCNTGGTPFLPALVAGPTTASRCGTGRCGTGISAALSAKIASASPAPGTAAGNSAFALPDMQEADACLTISSVSTLALHLQRTKAHEWNELIQVVIQGLMLAKSRANSNASAQDCHAGGHHHAGVADVW